MNLPNQLTVGRIVLVFVALVIATIEYKFDPAVGYVMRVTACVIALVAGLTDLLDGYIARKYNLVSNFGRLMDPLADKIFVTTCLITFVDAKIPGHIYPGAMSILPGWVVVVILAREFLVTGLRTLAASKGEVISADN